MCLHWLTHLFHDLLVYAYPYTFAKLALLLLHPALHVCCCSVSYHGLQPWFAYACAQCLPPAGRPAAPDMHRLWRPLRQGTTRTGALIEVEGLPLQSNMPGTPGRSHSPPGLSHVQGANKVWAL